MPAIEATHMKGATQKEIIGATSKRITTKPTYFNHSKNTYIHNSNDLRHTWQDDLCTNESQMDWIFDLRQQDRAVPEVHGVSVPSFVGRDPKEKPQQTIERFEGKYRIKYRNGGDTAPEDEQTLEKYQNWANTRHMVQSCHTLRLSGGKAEELDWQCNLRGGAQKPDMKWKRHFQKSHQSFDLAKKNLENPDYQKFSSSPLFTERDRWQWSVPAVLRRDDPISSGRWPGCEGTALQTWEHLVADRKHGHKGRDQIKWETTLREERASLPNWELGSKLSDNRSDGCIAEMLGTKAWNYPTTDDPLSKSYTNGGDVKLNHIRPVIGMPNDRTLAMRRNKQKRKVEPGERVSKEKPKSD